MVANRLKLFACVLVVAASAFFFSCEMPSPLYGTWGSGGTPGNTLTLVPDRTFTAKFSNTEYEGTYEVNLNIISFSMSNGTVVSEWDIRANVLYLTWTDEANNTTNHVMYKIKN